MSMLRNVLTYMGLGPDEDYDDGYLYDPGEQDDEIDLDESTTRRQRERHSGGSSPPGRAAARPDRRDSGGGHPPSERAESERSPDDGLPARRRQRDGVERRATRPPLRAVPAASTSDDGITVRSVPPPPVLPAPARQQAKPRVLAPRSFGDAKVLADEFKRSVPVIMNLQGVERDLARRLIDFASGICYALDGSMEKIASQVFLLTPKTVEVSEEDRRRFERRDDR
jgi:cell division inhibitor SepF